MGENRETAIVCEVRTAFLTLYNLTAERMYFLHIVELYTFTKDWWQGEAV